MHLRPTLVVRLHEVSAEEGHDLMNAVGLGHGIPARGHAMPVGGIGVDVRRDVAHGIVAIERVIGTRDRAPRLFKPPGVSALGGFPNLERLITLGILYVLDQQLIVQAD